MGAKTAEFANNWQWALRVTPVLGTIAVLLLLTVLEDPERGESEGGGHGQISHSTFVEDVKDIVKK